MSDTNDDPNTNLQKLMDEVRRQHPEWEARTAEEDQILASRGMSRMSQVGTDDPNGKVFGVLGMGYFRLPEGGGYESWLKMEDEPGFYGWHRVGDKEGSGNGH